MKCRVSNCENKDHQGNGIFLHIIDGTIEEPKLIWICIPCWLTLVGPHIEVRSQLYRNIIEYKETKKERPRKRVIVYNNRSYKRYKEVESE